MVVRFSALRAGRQPFTPRKIPDTHFYKILSRPPGHSAAGRIRLIEKINNLIGNRTGDFQACSIVPQPTTLPRAPVCTFTLCFYTRKYDYGGEFANTLTRKVTGSNTRVTYLDSLLSSLLLLDDMCRLRMFSAHKHTRDGSTVRIRRFSN
jgi:hypothetical protein